MACIYAVFVSGTIPYFLLDTVFILDRTIFDRTILNRPVSYRLIFYREVSDISMAVCLYFGYNNDGGGI